MKTLILCLFIFSSAIAAPKLTEDQKIDKLLSYITNLQNARFIRNGTEFPPAKAAAHMKHKLERDREKANIVSARDFIRICATKSNTTGRPYLIKYQDGTTVQLSELLLAELTKLEQQ